MHEKAKDGTLHVVNGSSGDSSAPKKRRRWDQTAGDTPTPGAGGGATKKSSWDEATTPSISRWDETPGRAKGAETPGATPGVSTRNWDTTPGHATPGAVTPGRETPGAQATPSARKNRWDETPKTERGMTSFCSHTRNFTPVSCHSHIKSPFSVDLGHHESGLLMITFVDD